MITIRPADSRGHAEHGWLDSRHTFSFGDYHDPRHMGFHALRAINEDRVTPGGGFAPHSHSAMEILSYVLEGGLRHRDSTGGSSVLRPGELQLMSAGRGISHSEMNDSQSAPVHFLQIWLTPERRDTAPNYQQHTLDPAALRAGFVCVAAPASETAPFKILADARLFIAWPSADQTLTQALAPTRHYYLQLARGSVTLGENLMTAGDAAMIEAESALHLTASSDAELLLFDLAPLE